MNIFLLNWQVAFKILKIAEYRVKSCSSVFIQIVYILLLFAFKHICLNFLFLNLLLFTRPTLIAVFEVFLIVYKYW